MTVQKEILVHGRKSPLIVNMIQKNDDVESQQLLPLETSATSTTTTTGSTTSSTKTNPSDLVLLPGQFQAPSKLVNIFCTITLGCLLLGSGYFLRDYIQRILVVVEHQDDVVIFTILILLYIVVSMPFAWGYILINVATGYLYGMLKGILVTFVTATIGIFIANYLIKAFFTKYVGRNIIHSNSFFESLNLVMSSKQQAFKIVVLSRLTPVPFGVQNAIFAMSSSLPTSKYLQATCLGLLPCQILNVYLGSTFRSMEQLLADSETAQLGAIVLGCQIAVAVAVTVFVVRRSRTELEASLQREVMKSKSKMQSAKIIIDGLEKGRLDQEENCPGRQ